MSCAPCDRRTDQDTRDASCWWALDVLDLVNVQGKCCSGFGIHGFGLGATTDDALLTAAQALANENLDWGDNCPSDGGVSTFQTLWNQDLSAGTDPAMAAATDSNGNVIGQLTVDGKYGAETAAAVQAALGSQSPTPCTTFNSGGTTPTGYSAAVIAAATALDSYLATSGCTACTAAGAPPSSSDPLSALVSTFKNAILVTPGSTSSSSATVTGSTINMSSAACQQSFGPGTIADLSAVLGSAKRSGSTACTDANCNCLAAFVQPPAPPVTCPAGQSLVNGVCTPNVNPPSPAPSSSSSSSSTAIVAGVILLGLGGTAVAYAAKKRKKHAPAHAY